MGSKEEASNVREDEGVAGSGRYRRPAASAPLTVPLERPPPRPTALEMVRRALLDGVGDNGGGQPWSYRTSANSIGDEGGQMRQRWNPRMWGADRGEDGGGARMQRRRQRGANSGTLECRKLDVNGLGECRKAKKFGKKGQAKGNFLLQTCVAKTRL